MKSAKDDPKVSDVYQTNQFNVSNSINFQTIKNESMNVYEKQRNSMYQKNEFQNKDWIKDKLTSHNKFIKNTYINEKLCYPSRSNEK